MWKNSEEGNLSEKFFTLLQVYVGAFSRVLAVDFDVLHDILAVLISWDIQTFFMINLGASNAVLDFLFPILTTTKNWLPIYVFGVGVLLVRGYRDRQNDGKRLVACALVLVGSVAVADQLSHRLLKEVIQRARPYEVLADVHKLVGSGGGSFPSNHALNSAVIAVILSTFFPRLRLLWWSYAAIIGLSRIYCGVHYPSDVLGGFLIGTAWAYLVLASLRRLWPQIPIGPPPQA